MKHPALSALHLERRQFFQPSFKKLASFLKSSPEPLLSGTERFARRWALGYRERLIREEVTSLESISDLGRLELLAMTLPDRVGSPLSINSLREDLRATRGLDQAPPNMWNCGCENTPRRLGMRCGRRLRSSSVESPAYPDPRPCRRPGACTRCGARPTRQDHQRVADDAAVQEGLSPAGAGRAEAAAAATVSASPAALTRCASFRRAKTSTPTPRSPPRPTPTTCNGSASSRCSRATCMVIDSRSDAQRASMGNMLITRMMKRGVRACRHRRRVSRRRRDRRDGHPGLVRRRHRDDAAVVPPCGRPERADRVRRRRGVPGRRDPRRRRQHHRRAGAPGRRDGRPVRSAGRPRGLPRAARSRGEPLWGLYPPSDETRAQHRAWVAGRPPPATLGYRRSR